MVNCVGAAHRDKTLTPTPHTLQSKSRYINVSYRNRKTGNMGKQTEIKRVCANKIYDRCDLTS